MLQRFFGEVKVFVIKEKIYLDTRKVGYTKNVYISLQNCNYS